MADIKTGQKLFCPPFFAQRFFCPHWHQDGTSRAADDALRAISRAVAMQEQKDHHDVRREMLERISTVMARSLAARIRRRRFVRRRVSDDERAVAAAARLTAMLDEEEDCFASGWQ